MKHNKNRAGCAKILYGRACDCIDQTNQTNEYIRYALAKLVYWNRRIEIDPKDSFLIAQLHLHLDYCTGLLGQSAYGLKEN